MHTATRMHAHIHTHVFRKKSAVNYSKTVIQRKDMPRTFCKYKDMG